MTRRAWTDADTAWLCEHYADTPAVILRAAFDRPDWQIYSKAFALGLHKTPEYLAGELGGRLRGGAVGAPWRFKPGHTTWNAGLKGISGHHPNTAANHFKPGTKPHTWKPIGSLRVTHEGYLQRKVTDTGYPPRDWVSVHRLVWEAAHGPVAPGHRVVFKARKPIADEAAIVPDVLECLSLREIMRRNSVHTVLPKPLAQLVQLRGALSRQINRKARQLQQQQQSQPEDTAP